MSLSKYTLGEIFGHKVEHSASGDDEACAPGCVACVHDILESVVHLATVGAGPILNKPMGVLVIAYTADGPLMASSGDSLDNQSIMLLNMKGAVDAVIKFQAEQEVQQIKVGGKLN